DRLQDPPVAGAAAQVAGQGVLELLLVRRQLAVLEQRADGEQHPGRAEAALERGMAGEGVLEPRELRSLGEALDRRHLAAGGVDREVAARADRQAVDQHRARAADLDVAGALRPGQAERVAEEVEQQLLRLDLADDALAVDATGELHRALRRRASPAAARRPSTPRRTRPGTSRAGAGARARARSAAARRAPRRSTAAARRAPASPRSAPPT